ncbi:hypothetical protein DK427_19720 [Methylobacterium radiodurans]|uniref:Recombinase domain-containing protein n=2 Tax=Methylobacterium radiodurans TaxID=2202828 RepID=A0A2U8VV76_9HYPH|nr:hypothetical protein DK427_19720 [Methylobacterium radiodurans]
MEYMSFLDFESEPVFDRIPAARYRGRPEGAAADPCQVDVLSSIPDVWDARGVIAVPAPAATGRKRGAYYTRYSTSGQNEVSTVRQIEGCSQYARPAGIDLVEDGIYSDEERSGGYLVNRDQLHALLERARARELDAVVIADPSRLSRDMVDLGWLWRQLRRWDVELHSATRGKMEALDVAIFGFLSQEQRQTIMENTSWARRQMVLDGLVPWGRRFGYRRVGNKAGHLEVDEDERKIIELIFDLVLEGISRARIARLLNLRGLMGRRSTPWTGDAITDVVDCILYRGILVYGRYRHVRNPETGKYKSYPRPRSEWKVRAVPRLAIIDADTWNRAQQLGRRTRQDAAPRGSSGKFLLSNLARCPRCGAAMVCLGKPKASEERRFACSGHLMNKGCPNNRSWSMGWIEAGVLKLLGEALDRPRLYAPYLRSLQAQSEKRARDIARERAELERRIERHTDELAGTFEEALTEGLTRSTLAELRRKLEVKLQDAKGSLALLKSSRPPVDIEKRVEELGNLGSALRALASAGTIDTGSVAGARLAAAIRSLIKEVIVLPDPQSHGIAITMRIRAWALLDSTGDDDGSTRTLTGTWVPPSKEEIRLARGCEEVSRHLAGGRCRLDDGAWNAIRHLVPPNACDRLDGERRDRRDLVDAMLLALRLRRPIADLPPDLGTRDRLRMAIRSLVRSGSWGRIVTILAERAPELLDGVDPSRFDYAIKKAAARHEGGAPSRKRLPLLIDLLGRAEGATIAEIQAVTGQTSRTIRSAISRLRLRRCRRIERCARADGGKAYRLVSDHAGAAGR